MWKADIQFNHNKMVSPNNNICACIFLLSNDTILLFVFKSALEIAGIKSRTSSSHTAIFINKPWGKNLQVDIWPVVHSAWVVIAYLWLPLNKNTWLVPDGWTVSGE